MRPGERLDRRQRVRGVAGLVRAVQRQEDLVVAPGHALQVDLLSAQRREPVGDAEVDALAQHDGADLGGTPHDDVEHVRLLLGQHDVGAGLDDAGLLRGDRLGTVAEVGRVVDGDRGDDGDLAVGDVRGVPGAAHADLDDRGVDRRVGERGVGHGDRHLEERQRDLRRVVDDLGVRGDVGERVDEPVLGQRLAVEADALGHRLQVRAGEASGAQVEGTQQGVDHARGRRLAVGAGEVDDRVGPLGVAEQAAERADAVEGRVEAGLGPPAEQGLLDLGVRGSHRGQYRGHPVDPCQWSHSSATCRGIAS